MTLVLTIQGRRTIWAAADGRLSYIGRKPRDEAMKVVTVEATDGLILLCYAGLGATALGSTVSDWVRLAFRGASGTVEDTLAAIAGLAQQEFQRHLSKLPPAFAQHTFLATTVVSGQIRLYTIGLQLSSDRQVVHVNFHRQNVLHDRPPRVAISGSGARHLLKSQAWVRPLLRLVAAHERGKITGRVVADQLARLLFDAHLRDDTVGPNGVVVWRYADVGGGEHQFYNGGLRAAGAWAAIPALARGTDVNQLVDAVTKHALASFEAMRNGQSGDMDSDAINAELRSMDWEAKPRLR